MRVFICGIDGYLGHSLACHLLSLGHTVAGTDSLKRREWVREVESDSGVPIASPGDRVAAFLERFGDQFGFAAHADLRDYRAVREMLTQFHPDAIVHLGEMPSAPFSMIDAEHAALTHDNNVVGSLNLLWAIKEVCPEAHLVKLGTMGEYGTPNCPIPEGRFPAGAMWDGGDNAPETNYIGEIGGMLFPRQAGSLYHLTKVHDTHNTEFACRMWDLKATDIMQGVVYGTWIEAMGDDPRLWTRFDFDECFGTAINRFCAQAIIGHPLTVYGSGHQKRGFLPLRDSMQCLTLAIENPPGEGEYRTFNQFEEVYSILKLANKVATVAELSGIDAHVEHLENPRKEAHEHCYQPDHQGLFDLGYVPARDMDTEIDRILADLRPHRERIDSFREAVMPKTRWDGTKRESRRMGAEYAV